MVATHLSVSALAESAHLFRGSICFQLVFFSRARDYTIFTLHSLTDFYVERVTAYCIKIDTHSCFHNLWPNSKTKLKLKNIWEQLGPWCFGGPAQLAYSAYRIGSG